MKDLGDAVVDFLIGMAAVAVGLWGLAMFMHGCYGW